MLTLLLTARFFKLRERVDVGVAELLQQPRRAFDAREEEGDRAGREVALSRKRHLCLQCVLDRRVERHRLDGIARSERRDRALVPFPLEGNASPTDLRLAGPRRRPQAQSAIRVADSARYSTE